MMMTYRVPVAMVLLAYSVVVTAATPVQGASQDVAANPAPALSLEDAEQQALRNNPGLAELQARAQAMAAIPSQVGTLPDPVIGFNALNLPTNSFDIEQENMTQMQFGISQKIPYPGKLALRERVAEQEAGVATEKVEEQRVRLIHDVRVMWWRIRYLDEALRIVASNQELLRQFVEIAQTKYKVGKGLQQDVLLAQLELSRLLERQVQLQGMRRGEEARLNALLDRPTDRPISLARAEDETLSPLADEQTLFMRAEQARPLLAGRHKLIDAARLRRQLAEKDLLPDFQIGAGYGFRSGQNPNRTDRADFLSLKIGMNIPLFAERKQRRAIDQRGSELQGSIYALQDSMRQVQRQISSAMADYHSASEQVRLFKTGIIPQARQTVASMLAGYQVGEVDFLNLVRSQITLYDYETRYWRVLSEAHAARASVAAAVGKDQINP